MNELKPRGASPASRFRRGSEISRLAAQTEKAVRRDDRHRHDPVPAVGQGGRRDRLPIRAGKVRRALQRKRRLGRRPGNHRAIGSAADREGGRDRRRA